MQAETAVALYAASYVVVLAAVTVQQKRGYTFFPSALSAIFCCCFWPMFALIFFVIYVGLHASAQWGRVENWWSQAEGDSHAG